MHKKLDAYGVAAIDFESLEMAKAYTYDDNNRSFPPTPLIFPENPFNQDIAKAKNILEIGCGVGRNLPWVLNSTSAKYYGIEPNPSMMKYFNELNVNHDKNRFELHTSFETLPNITFDVIFVTFVFQHITYRPSGSSMNVDDITKKAFEYASDSTVFLLIEHDLEEEGWIEKWFENNKILSDVYLRQWTRKGKCSVQSLTDRGTHDLIIFKKKFAT